MKSTISSCNCGISLRYTVTIDSVLANSKTERFLIHCERHFSSRLPPSGGTCKYTKAPSTKKTWRDSLSIDMFLSAVSVLFVAQLSSEIPKGLMNNPVLQYNNHSSNMCWSIVQVLKYFHHSSTSAEVLCKYCNTTTTVATFAEVLCKYWNTTTTVATYAEILCKYYNTTTTVAKYAEILC